MERVRLMRKGQGPNGSMEDNFAKMAQSQVCCLLSLALLVLTCTFLPAMTWLAVYQLSFTWLSFGYRLAVPKRKEKEDSGGASKPKRVSGNTGPRDSQGSSVALDCITHVAAYQHLSVLTVYSQWLCRVACFS